MILPIGEIVKIKTGKNRSKYVMGIVTLNNNEGGKFTATVSRAPGFTRNDKVIKRLKR